MLSTLRGLLTPCLPDWMKRFFSTYDPNADPLDLSRQSTRPARQPSAYGPKFDDRGYQAAYQPPWQEADAVDLSRRSTVPMRRDSGAFERQVTPMPEAPARRGSSALETRDASIVREASAAAARRRSSAGDPLADPSDDGGEDAQSPHLVHPDAPLRDSITHFKHQTRDQRGATSILAGYRASQEADGQYSAGEVRRSWPDPPGKGERQIVAANYSAVEIHGFFGLIDDGSDGAGRMLIVHVPKWIRGYFLDIKQGDTLHVYHAKGKKVGGALTVLSTGRHKYYAPGRRVTTCTVCVPEEQWAPFV